LSHETYIGMYINAVANSVMLYLHDFYNIIFKIKYIIYSLRVSPPAPRKNSWCAPVRGKKFCFVVGCALKTK
jgi:hypothetical protein